jgi:predicted phage replisome organizer
VASDVKWIKIVTDVFDDEKILMIETMPECDTIIVIWFKLLCLAGKQNNGGVFQMGQIPYTDEMFAAIFRRPINTVRLALTTFERFGMIEIIRETVTIPNWGKHQTLDAYEKKKARDRERIARKRAEQKALVGMSPDRSPDRSPCVAFLEEDKEEDKEIDIDKKKESTSCQQIVDLYHSICISFPKVRSLTEARKKAIKARLNSYSLDDFKTVFQNAEASSFLKGANDRNWTATFDWLIKDANMAKVLEGNYADKPKRYTRKEPTIYGASGELGDAELEAIRMMFNEPPETVESCPALAEQADELKRKMEAKYGKKGAQ